jgi:hypothetical protein
MLRKFLFGGLFLLSSYGLASQASPLYQVDMIVFTHLKNSATSSENTMAPILAPEMKHAIPLGLTTSSARTPYHLLPTSTSFLKDDYWALNRKPQYQMLLHYTWLQPANNQRAIALSQMNTGGWNVEGTMQIRRSNYYLLDTALLFSAPNSKQTAFVFSHKQRLKPGVTYYLDHPQAGMLIKIHQIT